MNIKKFGKMASVWLLAVLVFLAGCSSSNSNSGQTSSSNTSTAGSGSSAGTSSSSDTGASTKPASNGTITIGISSDITSFDPHASLNTNTGAVLVNIFDYLIIRDENDNLVPNLAVSWENIDDTTWRFKLREGVKFHNGDPFTAKDVKFSLERIAYGKEFTNSRNYEQIKEVRIIDDYTVDIITHEPDPILLNRISRIGSGMLPSKYIEENGVEYFAAHPIGTGPYMYKEWRKDDRIILEKFSDYWGGDPVWDEVVFRIIPEASTRVSELLTGGIDLAISVPATDISRINDNAGTHVERGLIKRVLFWLLKTSEGPTADPRVREAIDLAIDEQAIVDYIYEGGAVATRTITTPGVPGHEPSLYNTSLYDPERAKQLLAEAGYPNGVKLTVNAPQSRYLKDKEVAEITATMLEAVGFQVNLQILDNSLYADRQSAGTLQDMYLWGLSSSLSDPSSDYNRFTTAHSQGDSDYSNPEVDELHAAAGKNMNPEERAAQYQRIQQIIAEERPMIPQFQLMENYGVNDRIQFVPRIDEMFYVNNIKPAQ